MASPLPARDAYARGARWAGLALAYALLAWLSLAPPPGALATSLAPDAGDPVFNLYILRWGAEQWRQGLPDYWNAPFFYPTKRTVILSDHLLGPAAQEAVLEAVLPVPVDAAPIAAYNALLLSSFVLSGLAAAYVARRAGTSRTAAALAGFFFAFSPYRFSQLSHLQILLMQWIPLTLWLFHRLLAAPRWRTAAAFLAVYALHVTGGNYLAYMIHVPLAVILACHLVTHRRELVRPTALRVLAAVAAGCATLLFLVFRAYLHSGGDSPARGAGDWRAWGSAVTSFLTPGPFNWHWHTPLQRLFRPESSLLAGFGVTALAALGVVALFRAHWQRAPERPSRGWRIGLVAILALAGLAVLAADLHTLIHLDRFRLLGLRMRTDGYANPAYLLLAAGIAAAVLFGSRRRWPVALPGAPPWDKALLWAGLATLVIAFPVVYAPLAKLLPGLDRMRVPSRFYAFTSFAVAFFAARGWDGVVAWLRPRTRHASAILAVAGVLVCGELFPRGVAWNPMPRPAEIEPVYRWLDAQRDVSAIVELPFGNVFRELSYMYLQPFHGKPIVNGYSGYFPATNEQLRERFRPVPEGDTLALLRQLGVSHVVLHRTYHWRPPQLERIAAFAATPGVNKTYDDGHTQVFRIAEPAIEPSPTP